MTSSLHIRTCTVLIKDLRPYCQLRICETRSRKVCERCDAFETFVDAEVVVLFQPCFGALVPKRTIALGFTLGHQYWRLKMKSGVC